MTVKQLTGKIYDTNLVCYCIRRGSKMYYVHDDGEDKSVPILVSEAFYSAWLDQFQEAELIARKHRAEIAKLLRKARRNLAYPSK